MAKKTVERTARERLLAAANELFYTEGVHTVGIDRVLAHAGVAKASLYSSFGSKEELVRAYLRQRAEARALRIEAHLATLPDAKAKLLGVFDVQAELVSEPSYRGCAFVNASAEGPRASRVAETYPGSRCWLRERFAGLVREAGLPDPEGLAGSLVLLYDGVAVSASLDRDLDAPARARRLAELLLAAGP